MESKSHLLDQEFLGTRGARLRPILSEVRDALEAIAEENARWTELQQQQAEIPAQPMAPVPEEQPVTVSNPPPPVPHEEQLGGWEDRVLDAIREIQLQFDLFYSAQDIRQGFNKLLRPADEGSRPEDQPLGARTAEQLGKMYLFGGSGGGDRIGQLWGEGPSAIQEGEIAIVVWSDENVANRLRNSSGGHWGLGRCGRAEGPGVDEQTRQDADRVWKRFCEKPNNSRSKTGKAAQSQRQQAFTVQLQIQWPS